MSASTASVTDFSNTDDSRDRNKLGQSQAQCTPIPLPALGTQRIIQGNGTNVGTVISLQCPAKHKLVGGEVTCVMDTNSTRWDGETYCKPLSHYEDFGFRVAVLASIVSTAIILLMSMAFITCCWLDCIKEDKKKREERNSDMSQMEEQVQYHENSRNYSSNKGRNNNNNNKTQEKVLSLWDTRNPAMCDNIQACRCHHQYVYGPSRTYGHIPPLSALPGHDYDQPLLPGNPELMQFSEPPPQYFGPPQSSCQSTNPDLVPVSAAEPGVVWQHGGRQNGLPTAHESNARNINPAKEFSIRIISV